MHPVWLFLTACLLTGVGGAAGSILGHAAGPRGLWIGGALGGLATAVVHARLAVARRWIPTQAWRATALGTGLGFLAAAAVASQTLSSPVGPVLSTALAGIGALGGARFGARRRTPPSTSA